MRAAVPGGVADRGDVINMTDKLRKARDRATPKRLTNIKNIHYKIPLQITIEFLNFTAAV